MSFIVHQKLLTIFLFFLFLISTLSNILPGISGEDNPLIPEKPLADTSPPIFGINGTASTGNTGKRFLFSINITDDSAVNRVYVNYTWIGSGGVWVNNSMVNAGGSIYINNSIMPTFATTVTYLFWANDTFNNSNLTGPGYVTIADNEPPTYNSSSENITINAGEGFTIYANFTDNSGDTNVDVIKIYYKNRTAGAYTIKNMIKVGPGHFMITNTTMGINSSLDTRDIFYHFWVNDTYDNNLTYPIGYEFLVSIRGTQPPSIISGSGDFTVKCSGPPFTIYANFTDDGDVVAAYIYYYRESNETNITYINMSMTENSTQDGRFFISNSSMGLNIFNDTSTIYYHVIAFDEDDNTTKYNNSGIKDWMITIIDDIPPVSVSGSGSFIGYTSNPFDIWSNFTDNVNVTRAIIYFKLESKSSYCYCNMTPGNTPGVFSVSTDNICENSEIDTFYSTETIEYFCIGYDAFNNSADYNDSGIDWKITIIDDTPPEIINGSKDFIVTTGEPFTIYVNFSDNINISHAEIYYKRQGSEDPFLSKPMMESIGKPGYFYMTKNDLKIDTYNDDSDIWYYVIAYDTVGNTKEYRRVGALGYEVTIMDNDPPWVESADENITIGTGDTFSVRANFSDNIMISKIVFYYKNEHWDHWEEQEFTIDDDNDDKIWEFNISGQDLGVNINTQNDDSDYYYFIRVFDGTTPKPNYYNYTYEPLGFRIIVIDDDPPTSASLAGSGDFKATTGEPFNINANFVDNIDVDFAKLYVRMKSANSIFTGYNMTETTDKSGRFFISNYTLKINTSKNDSDYEYYVDCYDTTNNKYTYNSKGEPFIITIIDNDNPVAIAGQNQEVVEGNTVEFNGNQSYDNIGVVSYQWTFDYNKVGQSLDGEKTNFKFNIPGNYKITLTVKDAADNVGADILWVNVTETNYPPEIKAYKPEENQKLYLFMDIDIYVRFTEDMDIDVENVKFFFLNDSSGNPVDGSFQWFTDDVLEIYELRFFPTNELSYDETYTIVVTRNVREKTADGLYLKAGKTWSFSIHPEDSDSDGLPDWWEVKYFGKINEVGPTADDDNDGFTNLEEYEEGTDPTNRNDHPQKKEKDVETPLNLIIIVPIIILIILILIIILLAVMVRKKKKEEEEEESKKPKTIEHEILFEDGKGIPGPVPTPPSEAGFEGEIASETIPIEQPAPIEPPITGEEPYKDLEIEMESALETEASETTTLDESETEAELEEIDIEAEIEESIEDIEGVEEGVEGEGDLETEVDIEGEE